jgi:hypothetical protein
MGFIVVSTNKPGVYVPADVCTQMSFLLRNGTTWGQVYNKEKGTIGVAIIMELVDADELDMMGELKAYVTQHNLYKTSNDGTFKHIKVFIRGVGEERFRKQKTKVEALEDALPFMYIASAPNAEVPKWEGLLDLEWHYPK